MSDQPNNYPTPEPWMVKAADEIDHKLGLPLPQMDQAPEWCARIIALHYQAYQTRIKTPIEIAQEARAELVARAANEIAEAETEETRREATAPTRADMEHAVEILQGSERGRATMQGVLTLLDDSALGLDYRSQNAVLTLLRSAWGPFAGSSRDCMRDALDGDGVNSAPLPTSQPGRSAVKRAR